MGSDQIDSLGLSSIDAEAIRALLPPDVTLAPHVPRLYQYLSGTWQLPSDLVCCWLIAPWVECGNVTPQRVAAVLGPRAADLAEALVRVHRGNRQDLPRHFAARWRLFMLAALAPVASVLPIAELRAQL